MAQQAQPVPQTRYQRVQQILDAAAGDPPADYQGLGRFWRLPIPELLKVTLYGVPMIAPLEGPGSGGAPSAGEAHACCKKDASSGDSSPRRKPGRGAASGLIKGLKGEFPFDGSHFPPLMWGGQRVSPADIQFIESWIDDGLPVEDALPIKSASQERSLGLAAGTVEHTLSSRTVNAYQRETGSVRQRKNAEYLTPTELQKLRSAVVEVMARNAFPRDSRSWNAWARIHGDMCQHGWEQFLPWHRVYLYEFEQLLQDIDPDITLPYWDWTMPRYQQGRTGIIPTPYQAFLAEDSPQQLERAGVPAALVSAAAKLIGKSFNSGYAFFQALGAQQVGPYKKAFVAELRRVNPLWYPLRYPGIFVDPKTGKVDTDGLRNQFHHHYPTSDDLDGILKLTTFRDFGGGNIYDDSFGVLDMNPHNTMHIWVGGENPDSDPNNPDEPQIGDMLNNLTAAYDPIFWAHHSNVDRVWAQWQKLHPGSAPDDGTDTLPPFSRTVGDSYDIRELGYEYVLSTQLFETDPARGLTRFKSGSAGVSQPLLLEHKRVELRLHQVEQPMPSCIIRAFINQPDANELTPAEGNEHYAGSISIFGHEGCVGAEGHCDAPTGSSRRFDHRKRHHLSPQKFRMDVTSCVKRLVAKGARDLHVSLVPLVPGMRGRSRTDVLRLGAVSLTFKD